MPMIDVYAVSGTFGDKRTLALTPIGTLDRDKQLGVVNELTEIVAAAAGDPTQAERTWVLLTESPEGGWGMAGHAYTSDDIVAAARARLRTGSEEAKPSARSGG